MGDVLLKDVEHAELPLQASPKDTRVLSMRKKAKRVEMKGNGSLSAAGSLEASLQRGHICGGDIPKEFQGKVELMRRGPPNFGVRQSALESLLRCGEGLYKRLWDGHGNKKAPVDLRLGHGSGQILAAGGNEEFVPFFAG